MLNFFKFTLLLLAFSFDWMGANADPKRVKYKKIIASPDTNEYSVLESEDSLNEHGQKILIAILVQNHAHSLPVFLASLETLECPTSNKKCDLW